MPSGFCDPGLCWAVLAEVGSCSGIGCGELCRSICSSLVPCVDELIIVPSRPVAKCCAAHFGGKSDV
jgi:hypothetical protein